MMKVVTRQEGDAFCVTDSLTVTVLDICCGKVKLGFSSSRAGSSDTAAADSLSQIHRAGAGYYRFSSDKSRMLVLERTKGQCVIFERSKQLVVVDVKQAGVTLALCSLAERDAFEFDQAPSVDGRIPVLES